MSTINYENWFKRPTKRRLFIFLSFSFIGIFMLLAAMTDFFKTSPFEKKYLVVWFLIVISIYSDIKILLNYFKK